MKCKICGKEFELLKENHRIVQDPETTGIVTIFGTLQSKMYDSFDCPNCGCQNVVQERKRNVSFPMFCDTAETVDEHLFDEELDTTEELESNEHNMQVLREAKEELESGGGTYYEPDWDPIDKDNCDEASKENPSCIGKFNECDGKACSVRSFCESKTNEEKKEEHYNCVGCEFELHSMKCPQCSDCFKSNNPLRKNYQEYKTNLESKEDLAECYKEQFGCLPKKKNKPKKPTCFGDYDKCKAIECLWMSDCYKAHMTTEQWEDRTEPACFGNYIECTETKSKYCPHTAKCLAKQISKPDCFGDFLTFADDNPKCKKCKWLNECDAANFLKDGL